jgi:hypothetical protein
MTIAGKSFGVSDTPPDHQPVNIVGLALIQALGLEVGQDYWKWKRVLEYW